MNKQTYPIPEGCKAISMEIINNAIVTTFEPEKVEFKKGDIFATDFTNLKPTIFIKGEKGLLVYYDLHLGYLQFDVNYQMTVDRLATDTEKQLLFDALAKENKAWDAEKMEIVELKWKPKDMESYYFLTSIGGISGQKCINDSIDFKRITLGNCFKTEDEAQKFKEYILKYEPKKNN